MTPKRTAKEIVEAFKASGFQHMPNIPGNRVFYTDKTISTLVWAEANVVIEMYLVPPNMEIQLHQHPFINQLIFINGHMTATKSRSLDDVDDTKTRMFFTDRDHGVLGDYTPAGALHGFTTGPDGAMLYNVQIWPEDTVDATSASIEYIGGSMGPLHDVLLAEHNRVVGSSNPNRPAAE